jgi:ornithine cyclodeaminase/alanine dehydrogenase-like protein (mu-crystallin family)
MGAAMLYLTESDVVRFLPMRDCIGLMRTAFERLASGEAVNQPRRRLQLPTKSTLHYMAAGDGRYFGAKVYATNPRHGAYFLFLLYRAEDAAPLAVMEANHLGQIRTGAASALATQLLARPDSRRLAIIGSGFQACTQLEAMLAVLPFERVLVWSRSAEKRQAFAQKHGGKFDARVEAASSAEEAVRNADVIVTATNAAEPVLEDDWVAPGAHINAMGSNQARRRELPAELVRRSGLIAADSVEQSRMESGDLLEALSETDWRRVVELQQVVAGHAGRSSPGEITLFKSNGLAVEDVIAAGAVYERAVAAGAGIDLPPKR